jgi:WD40 repeat protein
MAEVFISYSRKDKDFVRKLGDAFVEAKRDAWLDWKDIPLTSEWQQEIYSNIEAADNFLFIISPESVASANCRKEIDRAVANNKRMLPILYRAVPDDDVPETLGKFQRIDFVSDDQFDEKFAALIKALDTDVTWVQTHTRLLTRAKEWEREGHDRSFHLRGKDLTEAEQWVAKGVEKEPKPTTLQSQYILASRQAATKTQRIIIGAVAVAFLIAVGLAIYAFLQKNVAQFETKEAQTQRGKADANAITAQKNADEATLQKDTAVKNEAEAKRQEGIAKEETAKAILEAKITNARRLATESLYRFGYTASDLAVSGALALESLEAYPTTEGVKALYQVLRLIPSAPTIIPGAHKGAVGSVAFSRDGRWMASGGGEDGQVILWDLADHASRRVLEPRNSFRFYSPAGAMDFSPDGRWLAAACAAGASEGSVCLWDTTTGKPAGDPVRHGYIVHSLAFSPDGQYLATATYGEGAGRGVRLFKIVSSQWKEVETSPGGEGPFISVAFAKDGTLAIADKSGVWMTQPESSPTGNVYRFADAGTCVNLSFFSGSSALAALCQKGVAIAEFKDQRYEFQSPKFAVASSRSIDQLRMAASPDGNLIVVEDIVYSIRDSTQSLLLAARDAHVSSVAFRPDGKAIGGGLEDGSVAFWPTTLGNSSIPVAGSTGVVIGVTVSPDDRLLATVSQEGAVRIYDISDPTHIRPGGQQKIGSDLKAASFSPDGRLLVLIAEDRVSLLHSDTLKPIANPGFSKVIVWAFTRDSRMLLVLDSGGVHRFEAATGRQLQPVMSGRFKDFSFSPDEKQLATWSQFNVGGQHHFIEARRVWNLTTGSQVAWEETGRQESDGPTSGPPQGGSQRLVKDSASWPSQTESRSRSADGQWSFDLNQYSSTLGLQEVSAQRPIARFEHEGNLIDAAFSPRGRWLVSSTRNGGVRLWPLQVDDLAKQACKLLPRNLTPAEWKEFQMDGPYRKTCPNLP